MVSSGRKVTSLVAVAILAIAAAIGSLACQTPGLPGEGIPTGPQFHARVFNEIVPGGFRGLSDCLICHQNIVDDLAAGGHWQWRGVASNIAGHATGFHGKRDLLNSFFIGVVSNEGRCAQCHISYGWTDRDFDFAHPAQMDCFVCHDTSGTYARHPNTGGGAASIVTGEGWRPAEPEDLVRLADLSGRPARRNCGGCHFYAEGGDNVLHGDMSSALASPTRDTDVHMGSTATGGKDFRCQTCHSMVGHRFAGWTLHSVAEGGAAPSCTRCHSDSSPHAGDPALAALLNRHTARLACELCHIPTIARQVPTLIGWYWDTAGQDVEPIPTDAWGKPTYDKNLGTLAWAKDVAPVPRWSDGKWRRKLVGVDDTYTTAGTLGDPVVIAEPIATKGTPNAKIRPFKKMLGRQPADTVNKRLIVPHLFGGAAGPNAFWEKYDWAAALQEGAAYSGVAYSGTYGFVNTVAYLQVNHEVPPAAQALKCESCHRTAWHWAALQLTDPLAN